MATVHKPARKAPKAPARRPGRAAAKPHPSDGDAAMTSRLADVKPEPRGITAALDVWRKA